MCPEFEMIDRQVTNDVSLFEAQIPFNPPQGKLIIDPRRAVKKFRRSAAGNYELAEDLRPPEVLLATTVYLMKDVLGDERWPTNSVPFSVLYAFIRDRLRAIRTDLTLQNCKNLSSIRIHELSIRFLIAAGHLLCEEERAAFEPQQNNEQLNGCLSALREMYKTVRLTGNNSPANDLLKYETEFQAYSIILSVDKKEAAVAISALPVDLLQNESIQVALEAYSAFQQTNYIKFMNLIKNDHRTTYLQACLLHQFVLPVRQRALNAMISLPDDFKTIPKAALINWLAFVDEDELFYYADRFGFKIFGNQVDLSALVSRGEVYDLRSEEENFKIRKFDAAIEKERRGNFDLSSVIFRGMDLDLNSVMAVLLKSGQSGANTLTITSELLASSSSPIPKQPAKKSFHTKSSLSNLSSQSSSSIDFPKFELPSQTQEPPTPTVPVVPTVIDQKEILKKKLEAQAQERQLRKERISQISSSMLDALIDSIVGGHVAEVCTFTWDTIRIEERKKRSDLIEKASLMIFEDLIQKEVLPSVLDIELMKIRCRAIDSFSNRALQINQSTFTVLNNLENDIFKEVVLESFLEYKKIIFCKKTWFNRMRRSFKETVSNWSSLFDITRFPLNYPVHLVFIGHDSFMESLSKTKPPNPLGYLQRTHTNNNNSCEQIEIIWSDTSQEFPFILSHIKQFSGRLDLFNWPTNFPGPTVIIAEKDNFIINCTEFPWEPKCLAIDSLNVDTFKRFIISAMNETVNLPNLNRNLSVSQLISEELIESFVTVDDCDNYDDYDDLLLVLLKGLLDKIVWILFKSPQASRLLSWHPITAGRSITLDSIRKSQSIPETFLNLFKANRSIQSTLESLDQIFGSAFTCNLESLYTTQTISDLFRTQKQIISSYSTKKRIKISSTDPPASKTNTTIDILKEKLRTEATESEAFEDFLKKLL